MYAVPRTLFLFRQIRKKDEEKERERKMLKAPNCPQDMIFGRDRLEVDESVKIKEQKDLW